MRVLLTGSTGFVGSYVARALIAAGHEVVALVRGGHAGKLGTLQGAVTPVDGDITRPETLPSALGGCEAVINLVGIIREDRHAGVTFERLHFEGAKHLIDAARTHGVRRFLQMSANGVKRAGTGYQETKYRAEEVLKASELDWTIFRPSMIFGESFGRMSFVGELAAPMRLAPAFPLFGSGEYPMQPVHVADVAEAFVKALESPHSLHQTYCQGGPAVMSYREVVATIAAGLGRPHLPLVPVPLPLVEWGVGLGEHLPGFPLTREQLAMLIEGNTCADDRWTRDFAIVPRAFSAEALDYLRHPHAEPLPAAGSRV